MFDMNTVHKYRDLLGDTTIAENRDEGSFIWDNSYDEEEGLTIMNWLYFFREKTDCMRNLKKSIARRHIRRKK